MLFSFSLIKKLVPELNKSVKELAGDLSLRSFEANPVNSKTLEVAVPPNRFSDAASYYGLSREIAAIYNLNFDEDSVLKIDPDFDRAPKLDIKEPKVCQRLSAQFFENIKIGSSPKWMQDILKDCGMRPINNLVDITNYVTLETGQPLHAFDLDEMDGEKIIVRRADKNELVELLDGEKFKLDSDTLVLSDDENALDIAGIRGGKKAEISKNTKRIILTAGNFEGTSIYKTSRKLKISTDASARFSHNLSPKLVEMGINRAGKLIKELCGGVCGPINDFYPKKPSRKLLKFDIKKFNKFSGLNLSEEDALNFLKKLGFKMLNDFIEIPVLRTDIEYPEDLMEEIIRLYGYENLKSKPPITALIYQKEEDQIILKDGVRDILINMGFSEVYNSSFVSSGDFSAVPLENPISNQFGYLRPTLYTHLSRNIEENLKYNDAVRIFEIGKAFSKSKKGIEEKLMLGAIIYGQNNFLEMKGVVVELLKRVGLVEFFTRDLNINVPFINKEVALRIESDHSILGFFGETKSGVYLEIDFEKLLKLIQEEKEYEPFSKYPSIMRDISLLTKDGVRVGDILNVIQEIGKSLVRDVDMMDFYEDEKLGAGRRSLTFRIVFGSDKKTLTDEEVNIELEKIITGLKQRFDLEVR